MTTEPLPPPRAADLVDPERAERLARLAARRAPVGGEQAPAAHLPVRRRHAARGSRAAALAMSVATTGGLAAWFAHAAQATASTTSSAVGAAAASAAGSGGTGSLIASLDTSSASGAGTAASTTATTSFTGTAVTTRYGTVRVAITTANGSITDVQAVSLPSGGKNTAFSNRAAPVLHTEALAAQSAGIDIVTGATYTSNGYIQSLQAAIDQAVSTGALPG